jgi:hypothetical protein
MAPNVQIVKNKMPTNQQSWLDIVALETRPHSNENDTQTQH